MKNEKIEVGVVEQNKLLLFYDYLNSQLDDNQYALLVTNNRGRVYTARMIDEDGEEWYIIKLLFENRYKRIKKESIRSFELKQLSR